MAEAEEIVPGIVTADVTAAAYEPDSGYADPTMTAAGLMAAARRNGARLHTSCGVTAVIVEDDHVRGVETARGRFGAPIVVNAARVSRTWPRYATPPRAMASLPSIIASVSRYGDATEPLLMLEVRGTGGFNGFVAVDEIWVAPP